MKIAINFLKDIKNDLIIIDSKLDEIKNSINDI